MGRQTPALCRAAGFLFSHVMATQRSIIDQSVAPLRYSGVVRWFNPDKGYGFIKVENQHDVVGSREFFCHYTGIRGKAWRNLKEGQTVEFEIVQGPQGDQANDAVVLAEPETLPEAA